MKTHWHQGHLLLLPASRGSRACQSPGQHRSAVDSCVEDEVKGLEGAVEVQRVAKSVDQMQLEEEEGGGGEGGGGGRRRGKRRRRRRSRRRRRRRDVMTGQGLGQC